jgi:hypothetical protein
LLAKSANISATAIPTLWYPLAVVRMAAVLASVVNKRPPLIMLVALGNIGGGAAHPGLVLALLVGVNI